MPHVTPQDSVIRISLNKILVETMVGEQVEFSKLLLVLYTSYDV